MLSLPSLPADSSSYPSLPFRPFSRLPTELVQHIIESTSSSYYHPDTYVERQSTLRFLCLTSRLFFRLAKPRLYAVVRLIQREQVKVFRDTEQDRAKVIGTFELVLNGFGFKADFDDLYPLLAVSFSLRSIRLEHFSDGIDLATFSRLKSMSHASTTISQLALTQVGVSRSDDLANIEFTALRHRYFCTVSSGRAESGWRFFGRSHRRNRLAVDVPNSTSPLVSRRSSSWTECIRPETGTSARPYLDGRGRHGQTRPRRFRQNQSENSVRPTRQTWLASPERQILSTLGVPTLGILDLRLRRAGGNRSSDVHSSPLRPLPRRLPFSRPSRPCS